MVGVRSENGLVDCSVQPRSALALDGVEQYTISVPLFAAVVVPCLFRRCGTDSRLVAAQVGTYCFVLEGSTPCNNKQADLSKTTEFVYIYIYSLLILRAALSSPIRSEACIVSSRAGGQDLDCKRQRLVANLRENSAWDAL